MVFEERQRMETNGYTGDVERTTRAFSFCHARQTVGSGRSCATAKQRSLIAAHFRRLAKQSVVDRTTLSPETEGVSSLIEFRGRLHVFPACL